MFHTLNKNHSYNNRAGNNYQLIPNIFANVFTCIYISLVSQLSLLVASSAFYLLCFLNFYFCNYHSVILSRYYYKEILSPY